MFYFILFSFGLAIGSFLNVLTLRYNPAGRLFSLNKLSGRSFCPHCRHRLKWFELVPVLSFIVQGGRCQLCRAEISLQYPLVELGSAAAFVGVYYYLGDFYGVNFHGFWHSFLISAWTTVFLVWLAIVVIDFRHYVVPDELNLALAALGLAIAAATAVNHAQLPPFHDSFLKSYSIIFSPPDNIFLKTLFGALAGGAFFSVLNFLTRGRGIGFGDVKLAFASGLVLGWPDIVLATALAFVLGGAAGGILLSANIKTMRDRLPFAPFFALGFGLTFFLGFEIVAGYFKIFNI